GFDVRGQSVAALARTCGLEASLRRVTLKADQFRSWQIGQLLSVCVNPAWFSLNCPILSVVDTATIELVPTVRAFRLGVSGFEPFLKWPFAHALGIADL